MYGFNDSSHGTAAVTFNGTDCKQSHPIDAGIVGIADPVAAATKELTVAQTWFCETGEELGSIDIDAALLVAYVVNADELGRADGRMMLLLGYDTAGMSGTVDCVNHVGAGHGHSCVSVGKLARVGLHIGFAAGAAFTWLKARSAKPRVYPCILVSTASSSRPRPYILLVASASLPIYTLRTSSPSRKD